MIDTIIHGDCLDVMQNIPSGSIDMILCDLPYGNKVCKWDTIIPFKPLWEQYERIIKDNGVIALNGSQPFSSSLAMSNLKLFRYEWIWEKNNSTGFQNSNIMPLKKHENILIFYKKKPVYNPQGLKEYGKINKRSRPGETIGEERVKSNCYIQKYTNYPTSILNFPYDKNKFHPTQKPVALFEYLIKTYTNEGETVLDNCLGSGTTAIAAVNAGRHFIGIEKEQKYVDISNSRLREVAK